MRVGVIGSVGSSLLTLQKLVEYSFNIVGVWGYEPHSTLNVVGIAQCVSWPRIIKYLIILL